MSYNNSTIYSKWTFKTIFLKKYGFTKSALMCWKSLCIYLFHGSQYLHYCNRFRKNSCKYAINNGNRTTGMNCLLIRCIKWTSMIKTWRNIHIFLHFPKLHLFQTYPIITFSEMIVVKFCESYLFWYILVIYINHL